MRKICKKWYSGPICQPCYQKKLYGNKPLSYWSKRSYDYRRTERGSFNVSKGNAKKRKIKWTLTFEQFCKLRKDKKCSYCKCDLPIVCGGLDRKNNNLGYTFNNSIACCSKCNYLKRDLLSYKEMLLVIKTLKKVRKGKFWNE